MKRTCFNPDKFHANQIPIYLFLIPLAIFMGMPIVFIINHAFKPLSELFAFPPRFFVENPSFENFQKLFQQASTSAVPLSRYIFNSAVVTIIVLIANIVIGALAAFAMSKLRFKGKYTMLEVNNLAMMFVGVAVVIPRYLVIDHMGITNTYWAHVLPLLAAPVGVFLIKQFTDQVPDSLVEAAIIDGASYWQVFLKVIMPMVKPALATIAVMTFQSVWGNVETSSMFTTRESMRTLTFFMNSLATNTGSVAGQGMAAAASLIMFLPNLIIFIAMQSKVMNTMAHSGIK